MRDVSEMRRRSGGEAKAHTGVHFVEPREFLVCGLDEFEELRPDVRRDTLEARSEALFGAGVSNPPTPQDLASANEMCEELTAVYSTKLSANLYFGASTMPQSAEAISPARLFCPSSLTYVKMKL